MSRGHFTSLRFYLYRGDGHLYLSEGLVIEEGNLNGSGTQPVRQLPNKESLPLWAMLPWLLGPILPPSPFSHACLMDTLPFRHRCLFLPIPASTPLLT